MAFAKRWKDNWELKSLTKDQLFSVIVEVVNTPALLIDIEFILEVIILLHAVIFEEATMKLLTFKIFKLFKELIEFPIPKLLDKIPPVNGK